MGLLLPQSSRYCRIVPVAAKGTQPKLTKGGQTMFNEVLQVADYYQIARGHHNEQLMITSRKRVTPRKVGQKCRVSVAGKCLVPAH